MKKKLIAVGVLISLLVSSLAVIASSLQPNDSPYPSNTLRIIEIGLDEGDRKLAYLLGDKNVVDGVSATNLDYEELIKNPDDLKKYASLVSNFEITGDDVEIDYTTEITDDTPSNKIYKQHGYLELATNDNYDYMSKYYMVEDPSTEKVYLDGVEIGVLSDFDFSEVYRKDSISDVYNKSDVGTYVKIGDYYYDLLNSECMLYKDENMDSTYELDTITPDDYVYMTLYGHVAYTGLWKDLDRYVLSDLYIEDENGDYVCLKNGYENLLNYTISSINTLDDSNIKELDTSKDILLFNKTNNSLVYDGKLSDVSYNVLNNDFLFVIGSKTYNLKNLIGYYLDTVDDTTENIVLKDSYSNIAYLGSKAGLKRYKEDYSKVFKKDKNGSYIKFIKDGSEIYYDLKSLTCDCKGLNLSLILYEYNEDYCYFRYIVEISDTLEIDKNYEKLYNKWVFKPAFRGRLYTFSNESYEYVLKEEIKTENYIIWEKLSDSFGIENGESRIKYYRDVTDSEDIDYVKANVKIGLKDMFHKISKDDNFAILKNDYDNVKYSFYTYDMLNKSVSILNGDKGWDLIYLDVRNEELNSLYKKYTKNDYTNVTKFSEIPYQVYNSMMSNRLGSTVICYDGDFANLSFDRTLNYRENMYAKSIIMHPKMLSKFGFKVSNATTRLDDLINSLYAIIDGDYDEFSSIAVDNIDLGTIAEHKVINLESGDSICNNPIIERKKTTEEVYEYAGVESLTARDAIGIMINTKPKQVLVKDNYRILEIEPCRSFLGGVNYKNEDDALPYANDNLYNWQMRLFAIDPYYDGNISVDRMSINEFVCSNKNLYDNYDIVYIGSKHDILSKNELPYIDKDDNYVNQTAIIPISFYFGNSTFIPYNKFGINEQVKSKSIIPNENHTTEVILRDWSGNWYYRNEKMKSMTFYRIDLSDCSLGNEIYTLGHYDTEKGNKYGLKSDSSDTLFECYVRVKFIYNSAGIKVDFGQNDYKALANVKETYEGVSYQTSYPFRNFPFYLNNKKFGLNMDLLSVNRDCYLSLSDSLSLNTYTYSFDTYYWGGNFDLANSSTDILEDSDLIDITPTGKYSFRLTVSDKVTKSEDTHIKYRFRLPLPTFSEDCNEVLIKCNSDNSYLSFDEESNLVFSDETEERYVAFNKSKNSISNGVLYDKDKNILGEVKTMFATSTKTIPIHVYADERGIVNKDQKIFTVYNDSSMNGKLYTHLGDIIVENEKNDDYDNNISAWGYYGLTNMRNEASRLSFIEGEKTRLSGNDLTEAKYEELKSFADNGKLLLLSDNFYNDDKINDAYFDKTSYMYKLVKNSKIQKLGNISNSVLNKLDNSDFSLSILDEPIRYRDVSRESETKWGVYLPESVGVLDEFDLLYAPRWSEQSYDVSTGILTTIELNSEIMLPKGCKMIRFNCDAEDKYTFTLKFNNGKGNAGYCQESQVIKNEKYLTGSYEKGVLIPVPSDGYHPSDRNGIYADRFSLSVSLKVKDNWQDNCPGNKVEDWIADFKNYNVTLHSADTIKKGVQFLSSNDFVSYEKLGLSDDSDAPATLEEKQNLFYRNDTNINVKFKINCNESKLFSLGVFVDNVSDGKFMEDEKLEDIIVEDSNGRAVDIDNLKPNIEYSLRTKLDNDICGIIHYLIRVYDNSNNACFTEYDSYIAVRNDISKQTKVLNVLQLLPNDTDATVKLYEDEDFKNSCKNLTDFNIVVMGATQDRDVYFNGKVIPKLSGAEYNTENAISAEWCKEYYKNFGLEYSGDEGLSIGDFDMLIIGFADAAVYVTNKELANAILDFKSSGRSILLTHDVVNHWYNYNKHASTLLTKYLRDSVGQDRFGITTPRDELDFDSIINGTDDSLYLFPKSSNNIEKSAIDKFTESSVSLGHDYCSNIDGGTFEGIEGISDIYAFKYRNKNVDQHLVLNDSIYKSEISDNPLPMCSVISVNNDGQINNYPYHIPSSINIAPTHFQYNQLNLNEDDITVWYSLSNVEGDSVIDAFSRAIGSDGRNNYYIYSKGNVTYSGVGHSGNLSTDEKKLFVNTLVMAYRATAKVPTVVLKNKNAELLDNVSYLYLDSDCCDTSIILDSNYLEDSNSVILEFEVSDKNIVASRTNYAQLVLIDKDGNRNYIDAEFYSNKAKDGGVSESDKLSLIDKDIFDDMINKKVKFSGISSGIYNIEDKHKFYAKVDIKDLLSCYNNGQELDSESFFTLPLECWLYTSYDSKVNRKWDSTSSDIQIIKRDLFNIK